MATRGVYLFPILVLLTASCASSAATAPAETPTESAATVLPTRTQPPTVPPTPTSLPREVMEQMDAVYTYIVVAQGNAEVVAEAASRAAAGSLEEGQLSSILESVETLAAQLDRGVSGLTVPDNVLGPWQAALEVQADTLDLVRRWKEGEIDAQEVTGQIEEVRAQAQLAAEEAGEVIAPLVGLSASSIAAVREGWLASTVAGAFEPAPVLYPCGEGESEEAGAGLRGRIAFVSDRDGDPEIYVMNADGTGATRLTNSPGGDYHPAWSPDGRRIAFYSERDGNAEIYAMNADGTEVTRLTNHTANDYDPAWSPDGMQIAFHSHRFGGAARIYVMHADGTGITRLTDPSFDDWSPSWSPDGSRLVFNSSRGPDLDIWVMNSDGTEMVNLTQTQLPGDDWWPDWSPVDDQIAFHSERGGDFDIYIMTSAGGDPTRLTDNPGNDYDPVWAPDGNSVAFTSDGAGQREICVVGADGSGLFNVSNRMSNDWAADWGR